MNISGLDLPSNRGGKVVEWDVEDPVALSFPRHCEVRDLIEQLVMNLVLELRRDSHLPRFRSLYGPR